jgi:hypothetical protein
MAMVSVGAIVISSVSALALVEASPAGANPYQSAQISFSGASQVFQAGTQWFKAASTIEKFGFGFSFLAGLLGPIFGLIANQGPTIQDVLDKLDQMTEQLDQIKQQLDEIDSRITQLQGQISNLTQQVADASCTNLQAGFRPYLDTILGLSATFQSMLTTAQSLPFSPDPEATRATIMQDFNGLAARGLGSSDSNSPLGGPLDVAIQGIHGLLMGQAIDPNGGVIHTCGEAGVLDTRKTDTGFVDDRPYYAFITALVNYYENYEILGLRLLQEVTYYRVSQSVHDPDVTASASQSKSLCGLDRVRSGAAASAAQLCRDGANLTETVYKNLVAELTLTGRPYSDSNQVIQISTAVSGGSSSAAGSVTPLLWVRDPKAVPSGMRHGTWSTQPQAGSYDGFGDWKPATNEQWQNLELGVAQTTPACARGLAHVEPPSSGKTSSGSPVVDPAVALAGTNVFCAMNASTQPDGSRAFNYQPGSVYWIPRESVTGLTLPVVDAKGKQMVVYGHTSTYPYYYAGPDLSLKCFVLAASTFRAPVVCSKEAWDQIVSGTLETDGATNTVGSAHYFITWCFEPGIFPGADLGQCTFSSVQYAPYEENVYNFDDARHAYKATIDRPVQGAYPEFLRGTTYDILHYTGETFGFKVTAKTVSVSSRGFEEGLWQARSVATKNTNTQQCVNTVGLPQLCAPIGGAKPTAEDQPFESFINDTIPNPAEPSPAARAAPTIKEVGGNAQCDSGGWHAAPPGWTYGAVTPLPTSWTGTSGLASYTTPAGGGSDTLDLQAFASAAKFDSTKPFLLTCTVSARWQHLINTGTALSATYQVTPRGSTYVVTQVPDAPIIGSAEAGNKSVAVHWTVGPTQGSPISSFIVTPYVKGVAQTPVKVAVGAPGVSGGAGSTDATTIGGLTNGTAYRFTVSAAATVPGTTTEVVSPGSSLSKPVTPAATAPVKPITTTTTTRPLVPISPTTTTSVPTGPDFNEKVTKTNSDTATASFTPKVPVDKVDLHYQVGSGGEQDFGMDLQSDGSYSQLIRNVASGEIVTYWFTYKLKSTGLGVDSKDFNYTQP